MKTYEVAFLVNGTKHCVPVRADGYEYRDAILELYVVVDEEVEVKCSFSNWVYVLRVDTETLPPAFITEEFKNAQILAAKKKPQVHT